MHLITVANKDHPGLQLWKLTALQHGWNPTVLGLGDDFELGWGYGFGAKFTYVQKFLQTLPENDLVVFTDGYDVLFQDGPERVQQAVKSLDAVLFAAEILENPDKQQYPVSSHVFPYLNAGIYAGTASRILSILPNQYDEFIEDQRHFTSVYLSTSRIVLDHTASVFACMYGYHRWKPCNSKITVEGSTPVILHMQGLYKDAYNLVSVLTKDPTLLQLAKAITRKPTFLETLYYMYTRATY